MYISLHKYASHYHILKNYTSCRYIIISFQIKKTKAIMAKNSIKQQRFISNIDFNFLCLLYNICYLSNLSAFHLFAIKYTVIYKFVIVVPHIK